jgi:hypothetical protein
MARNFGKQSVQYSILSILKISGSLMYLNSVCPCREVQLKMWGLCV